MSSAGEYKVDLDALDEVMKKINNVLKGMQDTRSRAGHSTYIDASAFGINFGEAKELHGAHETMKDYIENSILKKLEDLVDDLGKKTAMTRGAYEDQEHSVRSAMHGTGTTQTAAAPTSSTSSQGTLKG
jgi:hypothetical protein